MASTLHKSRIVQGQHGQSLAVETLSRGEIVAFSTETVYGLGGDATNDKAISLVFQAKGRPKFNPLIIHVSSIERARLLVEWNETADILAKTFWPGAITLVLPRLDSSPISHLASAGLNSLAIRIPSNKVALDLLTSLVFPIAAPSVNRSGGVSSTSAHHVDEEFGPEISLILDGGESVIGIESSIVDLTHKEPILLRPGGIPKEEIEALVGCINFGSKNEKIVAPGMLDRHYAPTTKLRMNAREPKDGEFFVGFGPNAPIDSINLSRSGNLTEAAANLFSTLRRLDNKFNKTIAVMPIPNIGLGHAINDRLMRASHKNR